MKVVLGERFGPATVVVDEHTAKAYAFAQDDYGRLLSRRDGGRPEVPVLVLGNRLLRIYEEKYERHANRGALQTRQEIWYHRPVVLGDASDDHRRLCRRQLLEATVVNSAENGW